MKMRNLIRLVAACSVMAISVPASAATFYSTLQFSRGPLYLSITTDGTQGVIQTENLVSYTAKYANFDLSGYGLGFDAGLYVGSGASPLTVSNGNLIFDGRSKGNVILYADGGATALIFGSFLNSAMTYQDLVKDASTVDGAVNSERFVLGSAVPEPSSWSLMLVGFGAAGGALRHKRQRAQIRTVTYG
jgi:hypothetical protein